MGRLSRRKKRSGGAPLSPHLYRDLVNAAVPAIHAGDPGSEVVMGTLAPSGSDLRSSNAPVRPLAFLRALACVDARYHAVRSGHCAGFVAPAADGFALHPHGIKASPDTPARSRDGGERFDDPVMVVPNNLHNLSEMPVVLGDGTLIGSYVDAAYRERKRKPVSLARRSR